MKRDEERQGEDEARRNIRWGTTIPYTEGSQDGSGVGKQTSRHSSLPRLGEETRLTVLSQESHTATYSTSLGHHGATSQASTRESPRTANPPYCKPITLKRKDRNHKPSPSTVLLSIGVSATLAFPGTSEARGVTALLLATLTASMFLQPKVPGDIDDTSRSGKVRLDQG
ncbi:hypothetical protein E2C01_084013 [Portunus trituberculatus]|uniref:Uncharacterized protein n=1 Tax=Portunus trituberculatus TaxID=210409 RepID=A0A5B7J9J6_PORTR|nr:hypothetical protein [Portunus trituberculatus]